MGWDSPSIGVWVKSFQDSFGVGIVDDLVVLWLGSELGSPLWDLLYSETWPPVGLQLIVNIPHGSNLRYHAFVGSSSRDTLAVPPSWSCPKFLTPHYGTCLTYPSRSTLAVTLSGVLLTLPWRRGRSCNYCKAKGDNKVEIKLEGLVGLGVFFMSILSSLHVIWSSNGLFNSP